MCDNSSALVRSLVTWDQTVLPATRQRRFSRLYRSILSVLIYRPRNGLSSVLRPRQQGIGYMGDIRVFTGQKTQPTVSKY